ncbi:MAG: HEPN domain-containing protein, partial [Candidatus Sungiibacteriota bacterium]
MTTKYVQNWFARGDDDLALVKLILEKGTGSPNLACFHAQQAAEKYLKGFLAHHELHVRKVHDLLILVEDCKGADPSFVQIREDAGYLTQFYIESRYPDDFVAFQRNDADTALEAVIRIKEFVLKKIEADTPSIAGFGISSIIIALAAAILLGGGFFAYKYQQYLRSIEYTGYTSPIQLPPQEVPDTLSWKTYRNEEYGFEVKYPKEWYYTGGERGNLQYLLCFNPRGLSGDCSFLLTLNHNTTLDAWIDRWKE